MKYALILVLLVAPAAAADDTTTAPLDEQQQQAQEFTKEELVAAKKSKERFLDKLRDDIAVQQDRLNRNRDLDSPERKELKVLVAEKKDEFSAALKQPTSHWVKQAEIDREEQEIANAKTVDEAKRARERSKEQSQETKENRPLSLEGLGLHLNRINLPQLVVVAKNNTDAPIEAYTVSAECFNKFDEPVKDIAGNNVYRGISQTAIRPGQEDKGIWQLSLHRNTAYAKVWITRVRFTDGTEWRQTKDEALSRKKAIFRVDLD